MTTWQPMDTAPKDRLILVSNGKHTALAQWRRLTHDEGFVMQEAWRPFYPGAYGWKWIEIPAWGGEEGGEAKWHPEKGKTYPAFEG